MRGPERSAYVAPTGTNSVEWLFQRTRGSIGPKLGEHPVSHFAENFDYFRALKDRQDSFKKAPKRRKNALRRPIELDALFDLARLHGGESFLAKSGKAMSSPRGQFARLEKEETRPIFNGIDAKRSEFPWLAVIGKKLSSGMHIYEEKELFCRTIIIGVKFKVICTGTVVEL